MSGVNEYFNDLYLKYGMVNACVTITSSTVANMQPRLGNVEKIAANNVIRLSNVESSTKTITSQTQALIYDIKMIRDAANLTTTLLQNNAQALDTAIDFVENEGRLKLNTIQTQALLNGNVIRSNVDVWNKSKIDGKDRIMFEKDGPTAIPELSSNAFYLEGKKIKPFTGNAYELLYGKIDAKLMPNTFESNLIKVDTLYVDHLRGQLGINVNMEETVVDATAIIDGEFDCDVIVTSGDFTFVETVTFQAGAEGSPGLVFDYPQHNGIFIDARGLTLTSGTTVVPIENIVLRQEVVDLEDMLRKDMVSDRQQVDSNLQTLSTVVAQNKTSTDSTIQALTNTVATNKAHQEANALSLSSVIAQNKTSTDSTIQALTNTVATNKAQQEANALSLSTAFVQNKTSTDSTIQALTDTVATNKAQQEANALSLSSVIEQNKTTTDSTIQTLTNTVATNKALQEANALSLSKVVIQNKATTDGDIQGLASTVATNKALQEANALSLSNVIVQNKVNTDSYIQTISTSLASDIAALASRVSVEEVNTIALRDNTNINASNISDIKTTISKLTLDGDNLVLSSNFIPTSNLAYDLGSPEMRWKDLYIGGNTIDMNGITIKENGGRIIIQNLEVQQITGDGSNLTGVTTPLVIDGITYSDASWVPLSGNAFLPNVAECHFIINGSGFAPSIVATIDGKPVDTTTYVSPSEIRVQTAGMPAGTYNIGLVRGDSVTATLLGSLVFSPLPAWTTGSLLGKVYYNEPLNKSLIAQEATGSSIMYSNSSPLPEGLILSPGGILSGNITSFNDAAYNISVMATDSESQSVTRTFSLGYRVFIDDGLIGWFNGSSIGMTSWSDLSGLGNDVGVFGSGLGNYQTPSGVTIVTGTTNTVLQFAQGFLPATYTIIHLCRYAPNTIHRKRILTNSGGSNWLSGFHNGIAGVAYHNGWVTPTTSSLDATKWLLSTDRNDLYRANGLDRTVPTPPSTSSSSIGVNNYISGERSGWEIAEILVYNRHLTIAEIEHNEYVLQKKFKDIIP